LRLWNGGEDFISFLSRSYAPLGAENDPQGLNRNWIKNVTHFYNKEKTYENSVPRSLKGKKVLPRSRKANR
jgi:hypothetical protein